MEGEFQAMLQEIKEKEEEMIPTGCNLILNYLPRHIDEGMLRVRILYPF